jgi:MFS family permease
MQGLFYSIYGAVVWPLIPLCVPAKTCGTAFGLATAIENLGLGLVPIAVGSIIQGASSDKTGYHWVTLYFLLMACVATIDHISLMIYSRNNPKFTNHGSSSVKVAEEENKLLHDPLSETTC